MLIHKNAKLTLNITNVFTRLIIWQCWLCEGPGGSVKFVQRLHQENMRKSLHSLLLEMKWG